MSMYFSRFFKVAGHNIGAILIVALVALLFLTLSNSAASARLPAAFDQAERGSVVSLTTGMSDFMPETT